MTIITNTTTDKNGDKYRQVFEHSDEAIVVAQDGMLQLVNPRAVELTGYSEEELLSRPFPDFIHPDDREMVVERYKKRLKGEEIPSRYAFRLDPKDKSTRWVEIGAVVIEWDGRPATLNFMTDITERKKAEEEVMRTSDMLRIVLDNSCDAIIIHDTDGRIIEVNNRMLELYRVDREQALTLTIADISAPDSPLEKAQQHWESVIAGTTQVFPWKARRPCDGTIFDVEVYLARITLDGQDRVLGNIRDVTGQKQAEEALRKIQAQLTEAMDLANLVNWECDVLSQIFSFNDRFYALYGTTAEREGGYLMPAEVYAREFVHPDEVDVVAQEMQNAINATDPDYTRRIEHRIVRRDGEVRHIAVQFGITKDANGVTVKTHGANQDITDRKQVEEALRKSEELYRTLSENTSDIHFIATKEGIFTYIGPQVQTLGFRPDEIVSQRVVDFIYPADRESALTAISTFLATGASILLEFRIQDSRGNIHWMQENSSFIRDSSGVITGFSGILRDITERKQAEDALALAIKKLNLLSSITRHDILNQLMVLKSYLALSRESLTDHDALLDFLNQEELAATTIEHQITFTRDYEELGMKTPVWQSVCENINMAQKRLPMQDIRVAVDLADLEVYADPLFEKIFYNLIDNALKHGGDTMTTIRIFAHESENGLMIVCEDDGAGISAKDKIHLFTKGFGKNTGLGLFLSREILSITGCTITENGEPGKGARFEITVPTGGYRFMKEIDA